MINLYSPPPLLPFFPLRLTVQPCDGLPWKRSLFFVVSYFLLFRSISLLFPPFVNNALSTTCLFLDM